MAPMPKICDMEGVREYSEGDPVELWRDETTGRLVIYAQNEAGYNSANVDLWDLIHWLSSGNGEGLLGAYGADAIGWPARNHSTGH
jgi:hypothetical protein